MRSLLVTLVFALSVSARCTPRQLEGQAVPVAGQAGQAPQKQAAENGAGLPSNVVEDLGTAGSSSGSSTGTATASTPETAMASTSGAATASTSGAATASTPGTSMPPTSSPSPSSGSTSEPESSNTTATDSEGIPTSFASAGAGSGNCGALKGICFNGGMQPSMYDKITTATEWITFQLNMPGGAASGRTTQDHVPMMAFAEHVSAAVEMVNGPNPPPWMITFNEPDFSYMGWTPTMTPEEAAKAIQPLLDRPGTSTKYVAPAVVNFGGDWHDRFFAACGCKDFFSAYNIHQYHKESSAVINDVTSFHNRWNDKPLWITEVAPGNAGCSLSWDQAGSFMKDIYKFAKSSGFVERVFWNSGNQLTNADENVCNSWLLDKDGNPGPLLEMYEKVDCT
ncbi:MAG: hypothetical protein Q9211_006498 [Gyalolechia sp. 1 TL-2023]